MAVENEFSPGKILFLDRLQDVQKQLGSDKMKLNLFVTSAKNGVTGNEPPLFQYKERRITTTDLTEAIGPEKDRSSTVAYVCGPPEMTDQFVAFLRETQGMDRNRILYEKWW